MMCMMKKCLRCIAASLKTLQLHLLEASVCGQTDQSTGTGHQLITGTFHSQIASHVNNQIKYALVCFEFDEDK